MLIVSDANGVSAYVTTMSARSFSPTTTGMSVKSMPPIITDLSVGNPGAIGIVSVYLPGSAPGTKNVPSGEKRPVAKPNPDAESGSDVLVGCIATVMRL